MTMYSHKWIYCTFIICWIMLFLYSSIMTSSHDEWHLSVSLSLRDWVSKRLYGISFRSLFFQKEPLDYSSVLFSGFCIHKNESARWDYGTPEFVTYMNHVYIPRRNKQLGINSTRIVYQKYGTPGIANQMKCACDTLLYALLANRTFQSMFFLCIRCSDYSIHSSRIICFAV